MPIGETISAIATAAGEGGIGIVRLSGAGAIQTASRMFRAVSGKSLEEAGKRGFCYGNIVREDGGIVDEAICLVMRSPHSYTKEDVVELQCHGGMMPLKETLALTYRHGARPAERGEFTKRAFLNGRLDLVEAQAVMNIVKARTEAALEMAAGHLAGHFSSRIRLMREALLALIAHIEAVIDFPEEGVEDVVLEETREKIKRVQEEVSAIIKTAHTGRILSEGLETAIVGKPNVGKSSLLNALLREERAIVTDIPGTTRDSIEEYVNIGGVPLKIIDTAGIRATDDAVERIGVKKARAYVKNAALVLALFDGSFPLEAEDEEILGLLEGKEAFFLVTKSDLPRRLDVADLRARFPERLILEITTREESGLAALRDALVRHVYGGKDTKIAGNFVDDLRTKNILEKVEKNLLEAMQSLDRGLELDLVSIELRVAWEKLGEITGDTINDDIIQEVFSRFCVGK